MAEVLDTFLPNYRAAPNPQSPDGRVPAEVMMNRRLRLIHDAVLPTLKRFQSPTRGKPGPEAVCLSGTIVPGTEDGLLTSSSKEPVSHRFTCTVQKESIAALKTPYWSRQWTGGTCSTRSAPKMLRWTAKSWRYQEGQIPEGNPERLELTEILNLHQNLNRKAERLQLDAFGLTRSPSWKAICTDGTKTFRIFPITLPGQGLATSQLTPL
ncbi:hypothetical protein CSKR_101851 [Clonorchis sinensis]|uniref:Uncharacterized protein n=1 Tax=Clonorchis sinensis TaxID=79923 RepID=A0A419QC86_CLOSI|nr:hypothetical protein CSKR_101851 [Clonorchis sinensis]